MPPLLLPAPAIASIVSVWTMPSIVAKPGLRVGTRWNTLQLIRWDVFLSGKRDTRPYSRLRLALRVSVSFGGTVSFSGSWCVASRYAPPPPHVRPGRREDHTDEVVDRVVRIGLVRGLHPRRRRCHEDDPVLRPDVRGRLLEIDQLRVVDVRAELLVDREQPPVRR